MLGRRVLLRWFAMGSTVALTGCGGSASGSDSSSGDIAVVPGGPSPTQTPTPAPSPTPTPTPTPTPAAVARSTIKRGANFSTIEGAPDTLPGHLNGEVFVTPDSHFAYYAKKGLDHIRLQGVWERMQPRLNGALGEQLFDHYDDPNNPLRNPVALVKHYLDLAAANNLKVILDLCHNYGERYVGYNGSWSNKRKAQLGSGDVPVSAFVDYCRKTVEAFGNHPAVYGIELMNEPHDLAIGTAGWQNACQDAINAIRKVTTTIAIVIDGYGWASAEAWPQRNPTIHQLTDPSNAILWSAHQYFDANSSGTYGGGGESAPSNANLGVQRLAPFIQWLKDKGFEKQGHIGEFGVPNRAEWQPIADNFMKSAAAAGLPLTAHQDEPYLNDSYPMNLFPQTDAGGHITGPDRLVIQTLQKL